VDHVLVVSCWNVFAVTVPLQFGLVDMIQSTIHATNTVFPIPCPLAVVMRIGKTA
jgi:hypothetical protein